MSSIEYNDQQLSPVNYKELLEAIQAELQKQAKVGKHLFLEKDKVIFDVDIIANAVAEKFADSNHYPFEIRDGLSHASVHALDINEKSDFSHDLQRTILAELHTQIAQCMSTKHHSLGQYVSTLLKPMDVFVQNKPAGLSYPINKEHTLEKRSLHANENLSKDDTWLKAHKLTLSVTNIDSFNQQIVDSINTYIENYDGCDEDDIADVRENLISAQNQEKSNLNQLKNIVLQDSVARIHREAKVCYLRYLGRGLMEWQKSKQPHSQNEKNVSKAILLLGNLIRRLQSLDAYIRQADKAYSEYTVYFRQQEFNYRDLFARADAFNALPIIPEIDGFLGENTDANRQTKTFTSGVKMKFNGEVHNHGGKGKSVFEFNTILLDPADQEYLLRQRAARNEHTFYEKMLKVALLYCFVFVDMENKNHNPVAYFETHILPALRSNDDAQVIASLQRLKQQVTQPAIKQNLDVLKKVIIEFLKKASSGPARLSFDMALTLDKSILTKDVNQIIQGNIFQDTFDSRNGKNALKYLAVTDNAPGANTLSKLPLKMVFEPIYYSPANQQVEHFTMRAQTDDIQVLPIFLAPVDEAAPNKYKKAYADITRIALYYRHHDVHGDSTRAFVYRFTYTLLAYTSIKLLADSLPSEQHQALFTPLMCIHAREMQAPDEKGDKYDDETFMHSLSKQLAHMLGQDYLSGSQGFHVDTIQDSSYKLANGLYSLYSALPHTFQLKEPTSDEAPVTPLPTNHLIKKMAIIVVSSQKSDANKHSPDSYLSTVIGKVIGIERGDDHTVTVRTLNTFSANQNSQDLYRRPDVIIEQVKKYHRQGYEHFLYIAHAPYSSKLNVSDGDDEDLFFMNKDIIQSMRAVDANIKVYPTFCDKYYVINRKLADVQNKPLLQADSLYIDDISDLTRVSNDPSRRSQVFLNLFNGIKVNPNAIYNGVMSYVTLINVYDNDPTYDQYIWTDLLNTSTPNNMKAEIIDFITMLHFSRYEKASQQKNPVGFKLDPYTDIIGDSAVGPLSIFPNMNAGRARFNALAFLTVVRAVMQIHTK
ncbi:hypothetical protein [Dictyobacter aurantiacus]|nr:hypothetical protein [Dictyobacter aurantiacus]